MKESVLIFLAILFSFSFYSCDPENVINNPAKYRDTTDMVWDTTSVVSISLSNSQITIVGKGAMAAGSVVTITKPGNYNINGTLSDGQIVVNTTEEGRVRLILNNVNITNSTTSPLYIDNAERTILVLPAGTTSTFTDNSTYVITPDSLNSTIYSKDDMVIFGEGILNINGNYKGGISSRDELEILSGNINVKSVSTGIRGKDHLLIKSGTISVNCGGDALKSDNDSSDLKGFVDIIDGTFTLSTSGGDGIAATKETTIDGGNFHITTGGGSTAIVGLISTKGIKGTLGLKIKAGTFVVNSSDNCLHSSKNIQIDGGTFTLSTANRAMKADSTLTLNDGLINVLVAYKGISGYKLIFNGGKTTVISKNDCLKATLGDDLTTADGSQILVNGGTLLLTTAKGDAVDSNGSIAISGGTIVVQGSQTTTDDAVSYRTTFLTNGGTLIASGGRTLSPTGSSTQNSVCIKLSTYLSPSSIICIQDENSNPVILYKVSKYAYFVLISTPALVTGKTYTVYTGGTVTGTDQNGYFAGGTYTAGTKRGTFTVAQGVNSVTM